MGFKMGMSWRNGRSAPRRSPARKSEASRRRTTTSGLPLKKIICQQFTTDGDSGAIANMGDVKARIYPKVHQGPGSLHSQTGAGAKPASSGAPPTASLILPNWIKSRPAGSLHTRKRGLERNSVGGFNSLWREGSK